MKLLNNIFWLTSQQVDIAVDTQNMGRSLNNEQKIDIHVKLLNNM